MEDFKKALKIFQNYARVSPVDCTIEPDGMIVRLNPEDVSDAEHAELAVLGFVQEHDYLIFHTD